MTIADINNKVYFYTATNSTYLPAATLLILVNNAYERVVSLIMQSDGRWEWDDSNQSDQPIATTTITSGQQDYSLAVTHLAITRVEMKYTDGIWRFLYPVDKGDTPHDVLNNYYGLSGVPVYYDKLGVSIFLYPNPNFTQAASLKVYFKRPPALK